MRFKEEEKLGMTFIFLVLITGRLVIVFIETEIIGRGIYFGEIIMSLVIYILF